jgi:predicted nucleic acid-binding protein
MILVDTSAWIDFFRGHNGLAARVDEALGANEVAVCGPILTEIRRGLRSKAERARVLSHLQGCHHLEEPGDLWNEAGELGFYLRGRGATVRSMDLLIATYALSHDVALLTADADFRLIARQKTGLQLA